MENREIRITRVFKAPIELMWDVWSKPEHIANWWGPNGFTNTIHKMEFKEEGEWTLTMHGPDGTNYPNRIVYKEIVQHKKIVFEHFYPYFFTTVIFEARGEETYIDWTMEFNTAEMKEIIIKAHKADEGQKQNLDKLGEYLNGVAIDS